MDNLKHPTKIIELDLKVVAKKSLLLTVFPLILLLALKGLIDDELSFTISFGAIFLFIVGYIALIVLHELFHLLGFRIFCGVPWKRMIIGVNLKMGVAYATTDQLMSNRGLRKALLLPFWMTGIIPAIIGLAIGNGLLILLAAFLIGGAAGDFAMYKELKALPDDWVVKDDPELPRLYVFETNPNPPLGAGDQ
ncbi:DUF3267 domain-containing protein [Sporosarcina sp. HYO08]|uniref:DUF3267 domain-containing protein n=1 Tax=Sporosarcina sp. HYO08 TaxID=1759557 RepID=UPI00079C1650|nr:DUF3267 domain-containing protein [Sporosarcina sp. HYO08]KXH80591.1 hypothetical protein AU377_07540 [Sporosarcina sp. HYO08]